MKPLLALSIGVCLILLLAVFFGEVALPMADILAALAGQGEHGVQIIIWEIRLPRAIAAIMVGAALGLSGAALQGLFRNPLAEPGVLGVNAMAALCATTAIFFGFTQLGTWIIPVAACLGAIVATVILLAATLSGTSLVSLILVGVGISSFSGALMLLLLNLAPNPFALSELINWTLGSVAYRSYPDILRVLPIMALGAFAVLSVRHSLRLSVLGEDIARAQGASMTILRFGIIIGTGLLAGGAVALAGMVGFVGIAAPHIIRPFVRYDPAASLIPSALLGACIVGLSDIAIRLIPSQTELKLGVLIALLGAPLFVWIAMRRPLMP